MAREIKFRAKVKYPDNYHGKRDIAEGEWISGDLHLRCRFPHIHTDIFNSYPIDVETIGQFVGMIYPDGTPVYEGDIVTGKNEEDTEDIVLVVEYGVIERVLPRNEENTVRIPCFHFKEVKTGERLFPIVEEGREEMFPLAGNIYDNPELLN
jgi:hypothetical protein